MGVSRFCRYLHLLYQIALVRTTDADYLQSRTFKLEAYLMISMQSVIKQAD